MNVDFKLSEDEMKVISALNADTWTGWGGPQVERNGTMEPWIVATGLGYTAVVVIGRVQMLCWGIKMH